MPIPFADSFLTGSILTLVLPVALLIAIAIAFLLALRRLPGEAGGMAGPRPAISDEERASVETPLQTPPPSES
ncbi:MAG TPA: hypothetical protein VGI87_08000 [Solirubrobacteraceae bacterium]|jgi:hypothetical protein